MATTLNVIITDAGIAEVINAEHTGTAPVVLTQVGLGRGVYTPTPDQTALHDEIKRLSAISGGVVGDNIMHIQALDGAAGASYAVYEIGVYTASGTLFAVYSQALPIIHKVADSEIMLAIDFVLAGFEPTSVTVGDTNYSLAPATTSNQGVVELATDEEAVAGTDAERALTPASGKAAIDDKIGTHSDLIAGDGVPGHFSYKIGSSVADSPFETFTEDGKTYHRLRTTYLTTILVTRSGGQDILGTKAFNGSVYFRSTATATSTSTFTFNGNVAFAPSGASAAVTFDNTGFRIGTGANPVAIDSDGIAVGGNTFDMGTFDYPVNSIKAKSVYAETGIYVSAYGGASGQTIGTSAAPFDAVYANNFHGCIPYPNNTSQTAKERYPIGCIVKAVAQAGAFTTGTLGFTCGAQNINSDTYTINIAEFNPADKIWVADNNFNLNSVAGGMKWVALSSVRGLGGSTVARTTSCEVFITRIQ